MVHDRLQQLLDYYSQDPDDPFIIYGLALEYQKTDTAKALKYFEILLNNHQDYLATYYHAAQLYHDLLQIEDAKGVYEAGIALATKTDEQHALRELKNAYQNFLFEEDLD